LDQFRKSLTLYDDYYRMMSDEVRMENYAKAIASVVRPGDTVMDLGCGPGILTFLALKAGAKKVFSVEKTDSIYLAKKIAEKNNYSDKIEFLQENSLNVNLAERVDVLLSETLGSFALEENTLEFTIDARDRFLKKNGKMIPEGFSVWTAPAESEKMEEQMYFWNNIRGIDFSPAQIEMSQRMFTENIPPESLLAKPARFAQIDLRTIQKRSIKNNLSFSILRNGILNGIAGWFNVRLTEGIAFDTSPVSKQTHWKQAFFPFRESFPVQEGGRLDVELTVSEKNSGMDSASITYEYKYSPP